MAIRGENCPSWQVSSKAQAMSGYWPNQKAGRRREGAPQSHSRRLSDAGWGGKVGQIGSGPKIQVTMVRDDACFYARWTTSRVPTLVQSDVFRTFWFVLVNDAVRYQPTLISCCGALTQLSRCPRTPAVTAWTTYLLINAVVLFCLA